jgi:hypothetical protein
LANEIPHRLKFYFCLHFQGEPSDCSEEQVESSLKRVATFRVGSQMQDVHNHAASMIDDAEMNNGNLAVEAVLCSDQKEHIGNSCAVVAESNIQVPPLQSEIGDCNDKSITLDDEVCEFPSWYILLLYTALASGELHLSYFTILNLKNLQLC